jgi:hypothetical protein
MFDRGLELENLTSCNGQGFFKKETFLLYLKTCGHEKINQSCLPILNLIYENYRGIFNHNFNSAMF